MERPVHVGLIGRDDPAFLADLSALPGKPAVRSFASLFANAADLLAFEPDVVFARVTAGESLEELAGAALMLRNLRPGCAIVWLIDRARELAVAPLCARVGAQLLCEPFSHAQLLAAFDHALAGGERPRAEVFLDLVHGIADEINNPLMFLMGHLQLLQLQMNPQASSDELEQVAAALAGAQRIHASVERMRRIEKASAGPRRADPFDLGAELAPLLLDPTGKMGPLSLVREPADAGFRILGDAEILRPALVGMVSLAREFQDNGAEVHAALMRLEGAVRIRLSLRGRAFADWSLPRTYEPYYLSRALRGTAQGLALFHLQAAAHGHRGRATARRLPDGTVAIDVDLPVS